MTIQARPPIDSERLPNFIFLGADARSEVIDLSSQAAKVRGCANRLLKMADAGSNVGLCFRTSPDLVWWWLGALLAGMRPLILQYPTGKQAHSYWGTSVGDTIERTGLEIVICDYPTARRLDEKFTNKVLCEPLPTCDDASPFVIERFSIIQLSSGTTGLRKAVEFTSEALVRHAADYNATLQLGEADTIVSWLPLYHDMGYVACFMIPMLLGVRVVMMDPEHWVNDKAMLFRAIEEHAGTVCYMPNFGFEVMSRFAPGNLSGMRLWISCSEPVFEHTAHKFISHVGGRTESFAACYAMAENIFAMTQSTGIKTQEISGVEVVSCGPPIEGVEIKSVDGEFWVRSPTSIAAYMSQETITDSDGFYPTGDMGQIIDGEIYVTGRKRDLLIQAGKKFMLSTIDDVVNRVVPEARGRVATLEDFDERLSTSKAVVLIESKDFFTRTDQSEVARRIVDDCGLDYLEVHFVPPRFLTKTSSGKMNRVISLKHWKAVQAAGKTSVAGNPAAEIAAEFKHMPFDTPVGQILDSLASTVLLIILADVNVEYNPALTLNDYIALATAKDGGEATQAAETALRIISLADRRILSRVTQEHIDGLSERLGTRVELEHVCLPPSPVLLSDLVFLDYFLPRLENQEDYLPMLRQRDLLRSASLILVDDAAELHFSLNQFYPVLSHRLERAPEADLLAFRWQSYTRNHDKLPIAVVSGHDLDLTDRDIPIDMLSRYLGVPIVRIATVTSLERFTQGWEYTDRQSLSGGPGLRPVKTKRLMDFLATWIGSRATPLALSPVRSGPALRLDDLPHFCSHYVIRAALDTVLDHYTSFCIAGNRSSVAHIRRRLDADSTKSYRHVTTPSRSALEAAQPYDCVLVCGPTIAIDHDYEGPVACVMGGSHGAVMLNSNEPALKDLRFRGKGKSCPADEWYHVSGVTGQSSDPQSIADAAQTAKLARDEKRQLRELRLTGSSSPTGPEIQSTDPLQTGDTPKHDTSVQSMKKEAQERRIEERRAARRAERRAER